MHLLASVHLQSIQCCLEPVSDGSCAPSSHLVAALPGERHWDWARGVYLLLSFKIIHVLQNRLSEGKFIYMKVGGFFSIAENYTGLSNAFGSWKINTYCNTI